MQYMSTFYLLSIHSQDLFFVQGGKTSIGHPATTKPLTLITTVQSYFALKNDGGDISLNKRWKVDIR